MDMDTRGWEIVRYTPDMQQVWDRFVEASRNGTFLFRRGYMDYHADRFHDCSWLAYRNGKLRALLPANLTDDGVLHSHGGLTYGGWVLPVGHIDGADLLEIFTASISTWKSEGIRELDYKPMPSIYSRRGIEEDRYALFRLGAVMTGCGLSTAVSLADGVELNQMQRRHLRDAAKHEWRIEETADVTPFMTLLTDCLAERHGVSPVHSAAEMQMLHDRFPENIRVFELKTAGNDMPDAGVLIYDTGVVAHAQYIATTARGRELNLLTPLFHRLMSDTFATRRWFDFGISTEENGRVLNTGLLRQKCSYGGSGIIYPRYTLPL